MVKKMLKSTYSPGLEVIKLEFILELKIKRKQPIISLYFEPENELKFYNLEARCCVLERHFICCLVLVQPRVTGNRPNMIEKSLTGTQNIKTNKYI